MTQAWTPEQTKTEVGEDGDILTVLRRVWTAYVDRSCSLYEKALENVEKGEDIRSTADYYKVQAENIQGVLNQ